MQDTPFERLKLHCSADWRFITSARARTAELLSRLRALNLPQNQNTSLVIFGSAGRYELTADSDLDWSLLVDGPADPAHVELLHRLKQALHGIAAEPGPTFGGLTSSYELVHYIGGVRDTNLNLTIRMLLLLESRSVNNDIVHERVIRAILNRYITSSTSVAWHEAPVEIIPRFLLNDFVRYWRTITVDYAAKRWEQSDKKWGIRNAKLRLSRKLLFVTGLLMCFKFEAEHSDERDAFVSDMATFPQKLAGFLLKETKKSPIGVLSETLLLREADLARRILDPYDAFLAVLDDSDQRRELETLRFEEAANNELFARVRKIGRDFQAGVSALFSLSPFDGLIAEYGVF